MDEPKAPRDFAFAIDAQHGPISLLMEQFIKTRAALDALAVIISELYGDDAETAIQKYLKLKQEFALEIACDIQVQNPPSEES